MSWVLCGILYISLQASGEIGLRDSIFSIFQLEDGQSRVIALTSQDQMVNACKEIFSSCSNRLRREVTNFLNSTAYDFVARKDETVATIKEGDTEKHIRINERIHLDYFYFGNLHAIRDYTGSYQSIKMTSQMRMIDSTQASVFSVSVKIAAVSKDVCMKAVSDIIWDVRQRAPGSIQESEMRDFTELFMENCAPAHDHPRFEFIQKREVYFKYDMMKFFEAKCAQKPGGCARVLEVGPGFIPHKAATHFVDAYPSQNLLSYAQENGITVTQVDTSRDPLPFPDDYFDFLYTSHCLEDLHEPTFAFREVCSLSLSRHLSLSPSLSLALCLF
jgi:hypothetical protein